MKMKLAQQLFEADCQNIKYDVFIAASGYESRGIKLAEKRHQQAETKIVIGFEEQRDLPNRIKNDKLFAGFGFSETIVSGGDYEKIIGLMNSVMTELDGKKNVSILVDYSCMTKVWYATILNYFANKTTEIQSLDLVFSYSPSVFSKPQPPMPNSYMGPIPGIYRVSTSCKPTALIMGLGYEKEAAKGLMEYLDPQGTYAFYSKPAFDAQFAEAVEVNNKKLIDSLGSDRIYAHPISDLKMTDALLTSLCLSLRNDYRIILAPLGPKPFALLCLMVAAKFPDIDVWRVTSGASGNIYDRAAANVDPIACKVVFEQQAVFERALRV